SGEGGAGLIADVFHSSALDITQQKKWLAVSYSTTAFIDCIVGMTIRQDQIEPSVIVVIEETQTPSTEHSGDWSQAGLHVDVLELLVSGIAIERCRFAVDVEHDEIFFSVAVKIAGIDAHAGSHSTVDSVACAGLEADFFEPFAVTIHPQEVFHGVIGD